MKLLVAGGAGLHRLGLRPPPARRRTRTTRCGCSTSSPTRGGARTSRAPMTAGSSWSRATSPTPRRSRAPIEGCDAIVNFAAESHVDRSIESPGRVHPDRRLRHLRPARGGPRARASATSRSRPTRSTARSSEGSFTESSPLEPSSPYSASKAGGDLIVGAFHHTYGADALIVRASNNYGPAPAPREADPALRPERARRRPAARLRRRHAGAQLALRRGLRRGDRPRARARRGRRGLQRRRPRRAAQHRRRARDPRADRPRRVADRARRPTAPATTAATRSPRTKPDELGWEPEVGFDEGIERTVDWYRENEGWWEPIRSGEYREYYERQYGTALELMPRRARDAARRRSSLIEPRSTATSAASWSRPSAPTPGASSASTSTSSRTTTPARAREHPARPALPDRARPGEAGPLPARADLGRRRRPAPRLADLRAVGGPRARRRAPPPALRPGRLRARLLRA